MATNVVEADAAAETAQTTVFVTDANVVSSKVMNHLTMDQAFRSSSFSMNSQDIKAFLAKPFTISQGVLSTTDTVSTFARLICPINTIPGMYSDKLRGFAGWRMDVKFRIVFNATRFQMGRYMLCWVPYGGTYLSTKIAAWDTAYTNTLTQRTQLQRVEFDLNCDSEATLEIPYTSMFNYIPISSISDANVPGQLGSIRLIPYEALTVDTGLQTVAYTLYASYHNVELVGAAAPQSGKREGRAKKRNDPTEQEQASKGIGPVESMMNIGYDISSALTAVPVLSNFALPASWIFDTAAGVAAHFGWSKPANLDTIKRITQNYAPYFGSVDNDDISLPLAGSVKNQVDPALGFSSTDLDEMDFKFFVTMPAHFRRVAWLTSDNVGLPLFEVQLSPRNFSISRPLQLPGVTDFTPVAFVAKHFKYWRGSIVFKIKLVKTEFHSGRLSIGFFPFNYNQPTPSAPLHGNSMYINRHILDIREANELTLTIPYLNESPWMDSDDNGAIGTFGIYVEDKLVAPSTVPQSCVLLIEVAGGPDMEFACPVPSYLSPALRAAPQSGIISREEPNNACSLVTAAIGGTELHENDVVNAAMCIGEKISSFRALLRHSNSLVGTAITAASSYKNFIPFAIPVYIADLAAPVIPFTTSDLYGTLASCYLFSRGGVRLKMLVLNDSDATQKVRTLVSYLSPRNRTDASPSRIYDNPGTTLESNATNPFEYQNGPKVLSRTADGQPLEVFVPQYHRYHSRVNMDHSVSTTFPYSFAKPSTVTPFIVDVQAPGVVAYNAYRANWFRSGADDCNFGVFISIPPMVTATGSVTN